MADFSEVTALAVDETSRARGHSYVTLAADADTRRVIFVTEGRDAKTIGALATELAEQRTDKSLKGMRWTLLKDSYSLKPEAAAALYELLTQPILKRTARAWFYKEQLREILDRKQINVICEMLHYCSACVMRSKVEATKEVAGLVRRHMEGIVAWAQTRQTNGFLEAINGLFQAAKRRARASKASPPSRPSSSRSRASSTSRQSTRKPGNPLEIQQSLNSNLTSIFARSSRRPCLACSAIRPSISDAGTVLKSNSP
jgi:transposase